MCGIAGLVLSRLDAVPDARACLVAMRQAIVHRGPDDAGLFLTPDGRVGLANCRLAIRDLSPAGHMPMASADGALQITHNGEIYNADELRAELEARGYTFRSRSDTEVILQGYAAWGEAVVDRLRGMFAFAVLDQRGGTGPRVLLARDRLGIKPFYYARTPEAFLFASEIKALLASGLLSRHISAPGLVGYLMLGSVPSPHAIYRDILALEPATTLVIEVGAPARRPQPRRYWQAPKPSREPLARPLAAEMVQAALRDAVRSHLVSDVPVGAFLSGGLDSSAVVALMRQATTGPIRTCSMVFEEAQYSEAPFARAMAEAMGAEHYERMVTAADVAAAMPRIFQAMDQPSIDGVNSYFVSRTAREAGLTVALSGLGGDELFGGYANTFRGVPRVLQAVRFGQAVPGGVGLVRAGIRTFAAQARWGKVRDALDRPPSAASAYLACRGLFSPGEVQALVTPDLWHAAAEVFDPVRHIADHAGGNWPNLDLFSWVSRAELGSYTRDQLLRDIDLMSMAHSLEVRVPLLDDRLVEMALRLPDAVKQDGGRPKSLLREAVGGLLPPAIRAPRDKQGFVFPFGAWLHGPLRHHCEGWQEGLGDLLRADGLARVRETWQAGRLHWSRAWALGALAGWRAASTWATDADVRACGRLAG
jgi:asparagine synthase (glutamine-hydrolysing)